jgi:hypothetical protein
MLFFAAFRLQVFDSAASKSSWAEALGFDDAGQHPRLPAPLSAAPSAAVLEPATPQADAAVQTDLSGPAESAGSTAAAPTATVSEGYTAASGPQQQQQQQDQQASSRQQQAAGVDAGDAAASSALLAAARHEILRLQELNRQLMQAHAEGAGLGWAALVRSRSLCSVLLGWIPCAARIDWTRKQCVCVSSRRAASSCMLLTMQATTNHQLQ